MKTAHAANAILEKSFHHKFKITHLKLQKLLYLVDYFYQKLYSTPMLPEKPIDMGFGVVYKSLWDELHHFGSLDVDRYLNDGFVVDKRDTRFYDSLRRVWGGYHRYTDLQLVAIVRSLFENH